MKPDPSSICFGLSEEIDRKSMAVYLQLAGRPEFTELFAERLSSEEISSFVDTFTGLLVKHLSENEYHEFFLGESHHHKE